MTDLGKKAIADASFARDVTEANVHQVVPAAGMVDIEPDLRRHDVDAGDRLTVDCTEPGH